MSVKENISLEIKDMLKAREEKIFNITKVMKDENLQDITRKSLENELHRLENEIETIVEVDTRCNLSFNNRNSIELSDREINLILGWYRDKKSQSESWCQQLDDLYDKLIDALNKNIPRTLAAINATTKVGSYSKPDTKKSSLKDAANKLNGTNK